MEQTHSSLGGQYNVAVDQQKTAIVAMYDERRATLEWQGPSFCQEQYEAKWGPVIAILARADALRAKTAALEAERATLMADMAALKTEMRI